METPIFTFTSDDGVSDSADSEGADSSAGALLSEDDPHPANAVRQIEDVITIAKSFLILVFFIPFFLHMIYYEEECFFSILP